MFDEDDGFQEDLGVDYDKAIKLFLFNPNTKRFVTRNTATGRYDTGKECTKAEVVDFLVAAHGFARKDAKKLLDSPGLPTYDRTDLRPFAPELFTESGSRVLNMWVPNGVTAKAGKWPTIERLLRRMTVDDAGFAWLLDFLAFRIAKWNMPSMVAVIFISAPGIGKSTFHKILARVWGPDNAKLLEPDELSKSFNAELLTGKLIVSADEVVKMDESRAQLLEKIKHYITGDQIRVEAKFQQAQHIPNRITWFLFTNHPNAITIQPHDRRFTVFSDMSPNIGPGGWSEWVANTFWDGVDFRPEIEEEILAFWYDLMQRDITNFRPVPLENKSREGLMMVTQDSAMQFIRELGEYGLEHFLNEFFEFGEHQGKVDVKQNVMQKQLTYDLYRKYCTRSGLFAKQKLNFFNSLKNAGVATVQHAFKTTGRKPACFDFSELVKTDEKVSD